MDNPGSISASSSNQLYSNDGPVLGHVGDISSASQAGSTHSNSNEPAKRRPGRPKGSTKKNLLGGTPPTPKIKRPVGRPRKDGFPAGSVGPTRPKIKRDAHPWTPPQGLTGVGYPPIGMFIPGAPVPPPMAIQIDPDLEKDDWAELAQSKPSSFISTLLSALAAPNPVSSAGPTVEEAFKSHLGSLAPNPQQVQPIPSLYSILKTFWLPSSPAYFSLTASASTARTPSEHRFLYWDPQPLVFNGISCPACSQALTNKGRISSGPVKIYDIEKPFFIIGCEYVCKSPQCVAATGAEGRKFASTDASILRSLPTKLQDEFPARLMYSETDAGSGPSIWNWKALGVSRSLWNMVRACLKSGLRKEVILHIIYSIQNGVPEEGDIAVSSNKSRQNENDHDENGDLEHNISMASSGDNDTTREETVVAQSLSDAYNNAWKENTAVADHSTAKGPSQSSMMTAGTQPNPGPPPHPYPPQQYPSYPYTPYAFFPSPHTNLQSPNNNPPIPGPGPGFAPEATDTENPSQAKRSPRHCCKCGSQECKGKGGRSFCSNPCQDCGKLDCKGRNSRRPDKKCSEGWV